MNRFLILMSLIMDQSTLAFSYIYGINISQNHSKVAFCLVNQSSSLRKASFETRYSNTDQVKSVEESLIYILGVLFSHSIISNKCANNLFSFNISHEAFDCYCPGVGMCRCC